MSHKIQIDDLVRDANADEIEELETHYSEATKHEAVITAQTAARASALAKLAGLGLTDDEIAALVG
jgi:hypothetical protein